VFSTVYLGRSDDPSDQFPGDLTVGEVLSGYEDVSNQPKLPVTQVSVAYSGDQHWQTLLDPNGIIGPDGKSVSFQSKISKQATVVFDTGFSLPQVPKVVSDAFYSSASGSTFTNVTGVGSVWLLPCTQELNVTFNFGGKSIPIHPLDMSIDPTDLGLPEMQTSDGADACIGTFQPISVDSPNYDMILGMAFRELTQSSFVYTVY
jgi:hypothetical protein